MTTETSKVGYQFTPMPKQLTHLLDVNLRSMLFALVDASNYFADEDGWFFRTNELFKLDSALSKNLVIATIDTLFQHSLVEVSCIGTGKAKKPNNYKVNMELFKIFEQLDMNTDLYRPENKIETVKYKGTGYHASYLDDEPERYLPELVKGKIIWNPAKPTNASTTDNTTVPTTEITKELTTNVTKSEHNIDNIDSIYNKEYINNREDIEYKENVKNIDNINKHNNNNIYTNNNILEEKLEEDKDKEELVREMEEGVTESNTKNEYETKEDPVDTNLNHIGDSERKSKNEIGAEETPCESKYLNPSEANQDSVQDDVQKEDGGESSSNPSQSNEEDTVQKQECDTSAKQPLLTFGEEYEQWKELVDPELEGMKKVFSRAEFHQKEKNFYKVYNGKVSEIGFVNEGVKKRVDYYIDDFISSWKYVAYCKFR